MYNNRSVPKSSLILWPSVLLVILLVSLQLDFQVNHWRDAIFSTLSFLVALGGLSTLYFVLRRIERHATHLGVIVDSAADAILSVDEDGQIETVNSAVIDHFGYRPAELIASHASILFSSHYREPEESQDFTAFLNLNHLNDAGRPCVITAIRRDGVKIPMELSVNRGRLGMRTVFIVVMRDIADRLAAQLALQEAYDMLEERVAQRTAELQHANTLLANEVLARNIAQSELEQSLASLQSAMSEIKQLKGLLPLCAHCKKVRDDHGYWGQLEQYIVENSNAQFTHGLCPDCIQELYPDLTLSVD